MMSLSIFKSLFFVFFVHHVFYAQLSSQEMIPVETVLKSESSSLEGVWEFQIQEGLALYEKGIFYVIKQEEKYSVTIKIDYGLLTAHDVIVEEDKISFNSNLRGVERFSFVLKVDQNELKGASYSEKDMYFVTAERKFLKKI